MNRKTTVAIVHPVCHVVADRNAVVAAYIRAVVPVYKQTTQHSRMIIHPITDTHVIKTHGKLVVDGHLLVVDAPGAGAGGKYPGCRLVGGWDEMWRQDPDR